MLQLQEYMPHLMQLTGSSASSLAAVQQKSSNSSSQVLSLVVQQVSDAAQPAACLHIRQGGGNSSREVCSVLLPTLEMLLHRQLGCKETEGPVAALKRWLFAALRQHPERSGGRKTSSTVLAWANHATYSGG
jgi:hypothetical protein